MAVDFIRRSEGLFLNFSIFIFACQQRDQELDWIIMLATALASSWESSGSSTTLSDSSSTSAANRRARHVHHHHHHHYHHGQASSSDSSVEQGPEQEEEQRQTRIQQQPVDQIQLQLELQHQRQQSYVYPKLQLVQIDDAWYALNQTCLQIYQQLQMCGTAQLMPVDVVPLHKVRRRARHQRHCLTFSIRSFDDQPCRSCDPIDPHPSDLNDY